MTSNFLKFTRPLALLKSAGPWVKRARRLALGLGLAGLLAACGGGGTVPATGVQLRPLSAEFASRKAVSYSPFRSANRDTEAVTAAMVEQDLRLLASGGFRMIRLFDSSDNVSKLTLQVIKANSLDIKVMLGAYILSESASGLSAAQKAANQTFNRAEISRAVALAQQYPDLVLSVSVGNETMVSWSFVPTDPTLIAAYLKSVRGQVAQPVTTDDDRGFYTSAPKLITDQLDFVSVHIYPLAETIPPAVASWDWQQQASPAASRATAMMDAAIAAAKVHFVDVRAHLDSQGLTAMPILVGETGWKTVANNGEFNRAHPVNQKMYFDRLSDWVNKTKNPSGPVSIVYFEAFDEPWKANDDKWGLFNVNRQARYVIQSLYPASQWEAGSYQASDAVYAPTILSSTVTANRYTLYADAVTSGEARVSGLQWFGWDSPANAFAGEGSDAALAAEGLHFMEITPAPAAYGWGVFATYNTSTDLSQFESTGRLNFSIKTSYPGKLRFGFLSGSAATAFDAYVTLSNTNADGYGYLNDGQWHAVSIPISAIKASGAPSYGNTAANAKFDLSKVTNPFVMNDIYDTTGNTTIKGNTTKIYIDGVYWSK